LWPRPEYIASGFTALGIGPQVYAWTGPESDGRMLRTYPDSKQVSMLSLFRHFMVTAAIRLFTHAELAP